MSLSGGSGVIDLENLDDLAEITIDGSLSGATTLNGMAFGGRLNYAGAPTQNVIVGVKDAATGTADVLNVGISGATNVDAKQLTMSGVETYNIVTDGTNDSGTLKHVISLTDNSIGTITIAGDAGLQVNYTGS